MAWTEPKTWSSEPLTSNDLNTYVRDNQNAIKARAENFAILDVNSIITANFTASGTSFVDVTDGSETVEVTLTTTDGSNGKVMVGFTGSAHIGGTSHSIYWNIAVDGTDYFGDNGCMLIVTTNVAVNCSFVVILEDISVGEHTFTLRWKGGDGSTRQFYATSLHPQLWAREI